MLRKIRGSDNKCTDMVADDFQYHRVCMNSYLTRRVHAQEKACTSTYTSPYDAALTQLISRIDEPLFRDGAIFFVTQFAFDNLDFQEYTKEGRTLHGTTHIIFQYKDAEEDPTPMASVPLLKSRRSSLDSPRPFDPKESHPSLKDRQRSRSLVGFVCFID